MAFPSILVLLATPPYLSLYISLPPFPGQLPSSCFPSLLFMLPVSYCSLCRDLNLPLSPESPLIFLVSPGSTPHLKIWSYDPHMKEITRRWFFSSHIASLNTLLCSLIHSWKEAQPSVPVHVLSCPELQTATLAPSSSSSGLGCCVHALSHPSYELPPQLVCWRSSQQAVSLLSFV